MGQFTTLLTCVCERDGGGGLRGSDRQTGDDENGNVRGCSSGKLIPLMDPLPCCPLGFTAATAAHLTGDGLLLMDAALLVFSREIPGWWSTLTGFTQYGCDRQCCSLFSKPLYKVLGLVSLFFLSRPVKSQPAL